MQISFQMISISAEIITLENISVVARVNRIPTANTELHDLLVVGRITAFELLISNCIRKVIFSHIYRTLVATTFDRAMEQRLKWGARPRLVNVLESH
jgi:hypothetical protein